MNDLINKFYDLIHFDSQEKTYLSNFVTIKDNFLFRRDATKLVALKLPNKHPESNYDLVDFKNIQNYQKISSSKEGVLTFSSKKDILQIKPANSNLKSFSLKALSYEKEPICSFELSTKEILKFIKYIDKELSFKEISQPTIIINPNKSELNLKELNSKKSISIKNFSGKKNMSIYSYLNFKEILLHASKFNEWIKFEIYNPFFTKISFDTHIFAVITHKKSFN